MSTIVSSSSAVVRCDTGGHDAVLRTGMQHPASQQLHPVVQLSSDALLITSPGPAPAQSPTSS